jgi:hypothetical protein
MSVFKQKEIVMKTLVLILAACSLIFAASQAEARQVRICGQAKMVNGKWVKTGKWHPCTSRDKPGVCIDSQSSGWCHI